MKQTIGEIIIAQIEADERAAAKYLLENIQDNSSMSRAVAIVESLATKKDKAFLDARRSVAAGQQAKDYARWVVKTQQKFAKLMETRCGRQVWESEAQLKRRWKHMVRLVAEVAARLK